MGGTIPHTMALITKVRAQTSRLMAISNTHKAINSTRTPISNTRTPISLTPREIRSSRNTIPTANRGNLELPQASLAPVILGLMALDLTAHRDHRDGSLMALRTHSSHRNPPTPLPRSS